PAVEPILRDHPTSPRRTLRRRTPRVLCGVLVRPPKLGALRDPPPRARAARFLVRARSERGSSRGNAADRGPGARLARSSRSQRLDAAAVRRIVDRRRATERRRAWLAGRTRPPCPLE